MNCKQFEKLLGQYMDGGLDEASAEAMRAHMKVCGDCAREFAVFEKITNELSHTVDEPLPIGFEQRWKQSLQSAAPRRKTSFGKLMPALAASVAAVAVIGTILATGMLTPSPKSMSFAAAGQAPKASAGGAAQSQTSITENAEAGSVMMAPAPAPVATAAAPEAPAASAAEPPAGEAQPQMKMAVQDSLAPISVTVPADTLDKLENSFASIESVKIEYTRSGNHLTIAITDQNKNAVTAIVKSTGLDIEPQTGVTYDFYTAE